MYNDRCSFSDKVVDMPVVYNDRCFGFPEQKTCGGAADAVLRGLDVSVTMQRLCGVDGDGAVEGFFRRIFTAFFGLLFGVEPCQFILRCCGCTRSLICH